MDTLKIWNNFNNQLLGLICTKVNHEDHCHDILQDVYIKVSENIDKITQAENMRGYLVRMAVNAVTDHYRKKSNFVVTDIPEDLSIPNQQDLSDTSLQLADCCLRPMIDSLPGIYREALVMTELEGMKHKDYAAKTEISLSNAKVRVQRAKEQLKQLILSCCSYEFDKYGNIVDCSKKEPQACCTKDGLTVCLFP